MGVVWTWVITVYYVITLGWNPLFFFPQLARVIDRLANFAEKYADLPTLGFTHYQWVWIQLQGPHQMCPICNVFTLPVCLMASSCLIFLQKNMQCLHVSPLFLLSLCLLCPQACPVDHSRKTSMFVAAGLDYGHAQPAASPWWPAFPGGQGDHWHPGQFLAAFSGGPRQGIKQQ